MASTRTQPDQTAESCATCGRDTLHRVALEFRTESDRAENRAFSREPYRVSTCAQCGTETVRRMNNARGRSNPCEHPFDATHTEPGTRPERRNLQEPSPPTR